MKITYIIPIIIIFMLATVALYPSSASLIIATIFSVILIVIQTIVILKGDGKENEKNDVLP